MEYDEKIFSSKEKLRIVQELVPGKQITLAHVIANPDPIMYRKLGLKPAVAYSKTASIEVETSDTVPSRISVPLNLSTKPISTPLAFMAISAVTIALSAGVMQTMPIAFLE